MYSGKKYIEATTKKEQCKVPLMPDWGLNPTYDKLPIEKMRKEYHEQGGRSCASAQAALDEKFGLGRKC